MNTQQKLVDALSLINGMPREIIDKASQGQYDDYKSELVMPKMQLVEDLKKAGFTDFAKRVIDGEFDQSLEEGEAWLRTEEGRKATLGFGDPVHRSKGQRARIRKRG